MCKANRAASAATPAAKTTGRRAIQGNAGRSSRWPRPGSNIGRPANVSRAGSKVNVTNRQINTPLPAIQPNSRRPRKSVNKVVKNARAVVTPPTTMPGPTMLAASRFASTAAPPLVRADS
jgi:hypothetical protein